MEPILIVNAYIILNCIARKRCGYCEANAASTGPSSCTRPSRVLANLAVGSCDHSHAHKLGKSKLSKLSYNWLRPLSFRSSTSSVSMDMTVGIFRIWLRRSWVRVAFHFSLVGHNYVVCNQFHVQWSYCQPFWFGNRFQKHCYHPLCQLIRVVTQRCTRLEGVPQCEEDRGRETRSETHRARN